MDTVIVKTVVQLLDEFGKRFGSTGEHLWHELVTGAVARVWGDITATLLVLLVGLVLCFATRHTDLSEPTFKGAGFIVSIAMFAIFFMAVTVSMSTWVSTLAAPEAAVLLQLLGK